MFAVGSRSCLSFCDKLDSDDVRSAPSDVCVCNWVGLVWLTKWINSIFFLIERHSFGHWRKKETHPAIELVRVGPSQKNWCVSI
jgi:hypothetical protein